MPEEQRDPVARWIDREVERAVADATASARGFGEVTWMEAFVRFMLDPTSGASARIPQLLPEQPAGTVEITTAYVHGNTFQINPGWQHFRSTEIGDICFVSDYVAGACTERRALLLQVKIASLPERPDLTGSSSRKELLLYSLWPSFCWQAGTLRKCLGLSSSSSSDDERFPREHERKGSWLKDKPLIDSYEIAQFGVVGDSSAARCAVHRLRSFRGSLNHEGSLGAVLDATLRFRRGESLWAPVANGDRGWNRIIDDIVRGSECTRIRKTLQYSMNELTRASVTPGTSSALATKSAAGRDPSPPNRPISDFRRGMLMIHASFTGLHPAELRSNR